MSLKWPWSLGHSRPIFFFFSFPPEVRLGSLESEGNAHCHSQIHGTKPLEPGWELRQKQLGAGAGGCVPGSTRCPAHPGKAPSPPGAPERKRVHGSWPDCLCQWLSDFVPEELPLPVARFSSQTWPPVNNDGAPHIVGETEKLKLPSSRPTNGGLGPIDSSVPHLAFIQTHSLPPLGNSSLNRVLS